MFLAVDDAEQVAIFWNLKLKMDITGKAVWAVRVYILRVYKVVSRIVMYSRLFTGVA
jgi:hypothetical protein